MSTTGTRDDVIGVPPGTRVPSGRMDAPADRTQDVTTVTTVALVLAAGGGSRFEDATHQLRARCGDATVVGRSVEAAVSSAAGSASRPSNACPRESATAFQALRTTFVIKA